MAERTVSPAVFTKEIDQTFLTQGISQIGGAVVGFSQEDMHTHLQLLEP